MAELIRIIRNKWITPPKPTTESYSGRIVIVTGATAGLGKEAAYKFAALGASKVIIAARDLKKGASTKDELAKRLGRDDQLEVWELDMMSYDSVVAFAQLAQGLEHVDIAILNAGTHRSKYHTTDKGWEEDLQTLVELVSRKVSTATTIEPLESRPVSERIFPDSWRVSWWIIVLSLSRV